MTGAGGDWVVRRAVLPDEAGAVTELVVEYMTWAHHRAEEVLGLREPPTDLEAIGGGWEAFQPPGGTLVVADLDGQLVGVGAVRSLSPGVAEVKRMYVVPELRGRGVGRAVLERLVVEAGAVGGVDVVRLDTARFMVEAQRLYTALGFVERPPYEGTEIPPDLQQHWRFFERSVSREPR